VSEKKIELKTVSKGEKVMVLLFLGLRREEGLGPGEKKELRVGRLPPFQNTGAQGPAPPQRPWDSEDRRIEVVSVKIEEKRKKRRKAKGGTAVLRERDERDGKTLFFFLKF
jgi:hypothetical protein